MNCRRYGKAPFKIAVVHGGPGAAGEMAPVAEELEKNFGVLEPIQTKCSIMGQADELKNILERNDDSPVILIGFSWGAWLAIITAAQNPELVNALILIGCGPFQEKDAADIMKLRLERMDENRRKKVLHLSAQLQNPAVEEKNSIFCEMGNLLNEADSYDAIPCSGEKLECRFDIYQKVWNEAHELRRSGRLLELTKRIQCPVLAVHGKYDSHPAKAVKGPLSEILEDFQFVLLEKCGHKPWIERFARNKFYDILRDKVAAFQ